MSTPNAHEYHIITMIYRLATKRSRLHFNMFMRIWIETNRSHNNNGNSNSAEQNWKNETNKKKRHDTKCYIENKYERTKEKYQWAAQILGEQIANYLANSGVGGIPMRFDSMRVWVSVCACGSEWSNARITNIVNFSCFEMRMRLSNAHHNLLCAWIASSLARAQLKTTTVTRNMHIVPTA